MMRYHLSPALRQTKPQWADKLGKCVLESGACMRVKVDWAPAYMAGKTTTTSPLIEQVVAKDGAVEVKVKVEILISMRGDDGMGPEPDSGSNHPI